MSQWGTEKKVNKARFVPHVTTKAFHKTTPNSLVDTIYLLDDGYNPGIAEMTLAILKENHVDRPYGEWCQLPAASTLDV